MLPSFDKEGQRWLKPALGGWNARGTHHPSCGLSATASPPRPRRGAFVVLWSSRTIPRNRRSSERRNALTSTSRSLFTTVCVLVPNQLRQRWSQRL